ncbi:MAG: hypothetical protein HYR63_05415 [Proteobacteria bacterium]|nr:hypothetical protein [Pseudomonadota bacterium]MBI3495865.1 hypothetical protein [Pseudomonadota bacterium]
MTILLYSRAPDLDAWADGLKAADPGLEVRRWPAIGDPGEIECLLASRPAGRGKPAPRSPRAQTDP